MKIRIYETEGLNIDTVNELMRNADRQANFDPGARWIMFASEVKETEQSSKNSMNYRYRNLYVKWIGLEAVITWLTSNQILFEVMSYELLQEEQEAIEERYPEEEINKEQIILN